jgi:predicted DNA-binding transcriptional regulator YafY
MPAYTRVHRLLKILTLIRSGSAATPAALADSCGVDQRTIYRDLNELEAVGIAVRFDKSTGAYSVDGECFLPPVQLTADEALAIAVLCGQIAEKEQIPFTRAAWRGLAKIQAGMPDSVRREIAQVAHSVFIQTAQSVPPDGFEGVYERVQRAISEGVVLRCRYDSLNRDTDDGEEFNFKPYALFFAVRAWYAVGLHGGRGAVRTLKLNRFSGIQLTDHRYEIPADFAMDAHLGNAWRMMRGDEDHEVSVRFDPVFAETIGETLWHRTQQIEEQADGGVIFRCTVSGLDEIVWWVLSMGPHCEVLGPEVLRSRVAAASAMMAGRYAKGDG